MKDNIIVLVSVIKLVGVTYFVWFVMTLLHFKRQ